MNSNDLMPLANTYAELNSREALKAHLLNWVDAHAHGRPSGIVNMSRKYNKTARKFGCSVLELLSELHIENKLLLFTYSLTDAHFVLASDTKDALVNRIVEELTEAGIPAEPYYINERVADRLQLMTKHVVAAK